MGVVMLPMIFGSSLSFRWHVLRLRLHGYTVRTVDLYRGQVFRRPFFARLVGGVDERQRLNELAARFDDAPIIRQIERAALELHRHCGRVVLMGFGLGGIYALKYAEYTMWISGVIAWYPHLRFPLGFPKVPPNCECMASPVLLFYGDRDDKVEPSTVEQAQELDINSLHITTVIFPNAGHAFADAYVQYCFPNPLWHPSHSRQSWKMARQTLALWTRANF